MRDTCHWFEPSIARGQDKECNEAIAGNVRVQIALGMHALVPLCVKHKAEFNRKQAESRVGRQAGGR